MDSQRSPAQDESIPPQELNAFQDYVRHYPRGRVIIVEGERDNLGLFLLRQGQVAVYKRTGTRRELLATIKAINFFGEMAVVDDGPRSATVEADSDEVTAYSFPRPRLSALLTNSTWGAMLVTRLASDLREKNELLAECRSDAEQKSAGQAELLRRDERLTSGIIEIASVMTGLQACVAQDAVVNGREWTYLRGVEEVLRRIIRARLPELADSLISAGPMLWERLYQEKILPDDMYQCAIKYSGLAYK